MKRSTKEAIQNARRKPKASAERVEALERLRDEVEAAHREKTWYARENRMVAILNELEKL